MTMKRSHSWFMALVAVSLLTYACKDKPKAETGSLVLSSSSVTAKAHYNNDTTQLGLTVSASIDYPANYPDPVVLNKVRQVMLMDYFPEADSVFHSPKDVLNAYIDDYKKFFFESESAYADVKDEESMYSTDPWYNNQKTVLRYNNKYLFSYTVATDRYSGGAHGEKKYINTVVDLRSGKKITEDDLFTEKAKAMIVTIIVDKIMKQHNVNSVEDLEEIGYLDMNQLSLNNFYLTDKGLTYTFNEYEIAGYAVGTTEVFLDFNSLSNYLKPGNPLAALLD